MIVHPPDRRLYLFFLVVIMIAHPPDRRLELFFYLEEPVRVASTTRINLEDPVRVASTTRINLTLCLSVMAVRAKRVE